MTVLHALAFDHGEIIASRPRAGKIGSEGDGSSEASGGWNRRAVSGRSCLAVASVAAVACLAAAIPVRNRVMNERLVSLPIFQGMTPEECAAVGATVAELLSAHARRMDGRLPACRPHHLAKALRRAVLGAVDMCSTCDYAWCMPVMIQVRNVPESLHRKLKARAAMAGMSLSEYLLAEIRDVAARPSSRELLERLRRLEPVKTRISAAAAVRSERDSR